MARLKFFNRRLRLFLALFIVVLLVLSIWLLAFKQEPKAPADKTSESSSAFNKSLFSTEEPGSLWVVVNKGRRLSADFVPRSLATPAVKVRPNAHKDEKQLQQQAATALEEMFSAAQQASLPLILVSGYRSYSLQVPVYNGHVSRSGRLAADKVSARPGHSEHQTGLAADVGPLSRRCELATCFGELPEGQWVAAIAHKYGFIIRYQKDNESLTGYSYEPWHLRYVGIELATQLFQRAQTMEQFFDLPIWADYPTSIYELK